MKRSILALLFLIPVFLSAQQHTFQTRIYFATNSYELSSDSKRVLDSVVSLTGTSGVYKIELSAHTDQKGDKRFNQHLSQQREKVALNYLEKSGADPLFIKSSHHGEDIPVLAPLETEDVAENRRVEIRLTYTVFNTVDEVLNYTGIQSEQRFTFTDNGVQEVEGKKGTQLVIPENAFQTKDGVLIPNGDVTFVLEEYPGIGDAITHQLSTLSGGQILESGGMFRMEALYQGEALELRAGKEIDVLLPSKNLQPGMSVFVGERNEQGVVVWEDTKAPFKAIDTTKNPKLPLPGFSSFLRSLRISPPEKLAYTALEFTMAVPQRPLRPTHPHHPVMPAQPTPPEGSKPIVGALNDEWRAFKKAEKQFAADMRNYDKRMEQYERSTLRYKKRYALYLQDSVKYYSDSIAWTAMLENMKRDRLANIEKFDAMYDLQRFNGGLNSLAKKIDDSLYYNSFLSGALNRMTNASVENQAHNAIGALYQDLWLIATLSSPEFEKKRKLICTGNKVDYKVYRRNIKNRRILVHNPEIANLMQETSRNRFFDTLMADSASKKELQYMEAVIRQKKRELGIFDKSDAVNMYQASLSRMGMINCDRFSSYAPEQLARLDVQVPPGSKVFVVIPRINSMIPLYASHDSTSAVTLPVGEDIKVVSVGAANGRPTFDYQRVRLTANTNRVLLQPKTVSVNTLQEQLDGL